MIVSPLALGTMTFGAHRWGASKDTSRTLFDAYVHAGGNFLDTADVYSSGRREEILGSFLSGSGLRDRLVIATKSGFHLGEGARLWDGNGAKNVRVSSRKMVSSSGKCTLRFPPKIEYSISPLGRSLEPILIALKAWGDGNIGRFGKPVAANAA